ncbi:MAG: segregation/condensation protein A [Clostridium sp.]
MEISYKLENFEGPLDLLLHLIEKNKVSIYDIPIVLITEQYLAYVSHMEKQDLDVVSDFLVMAATLIAIKSKMLLPADEPEDEEEEDPRAELVRRLLEYKTYKHMAEELETREEDAEKLLYKNPTIPGEVTKYEPPVELDSLLSGLTLAKLQQIFESVLKRKEDKIDPVRSKFGTIRKEAVSLEQRIESVLSFTRMHRHCSFRQLLDRQSDRTEVVVTFLAILELMKTGKIRLQQEAIFDDIYIEAVE